MFLIDGNNVMAQRVGWHRDKPNAQKRLLKHISEKIITNGGNAIVVFDGTPLRNLNDGDLFDGVKVFFAHPGSDADHRIIELAERLKHQDNIITVTSDKLLAQNLKCLGIDVMRSGRFRKVLEK